ncbi:hypothetical protein [Klebsiella pneumoniae]|uniref:hypothetical protein n=1 Tax=Klebsiella pneumoniae TaxID=573 RepID=UPI000E2C1FA9|nr:hypothetical protein [Klebsiella pneumoniae]SXB99908.1 Uncharacterised protein [Klebsiella pneumoniae]
MKVIEDELYTLLKLDNGYRIYKTEDVIICWMPDPDSTHQFLKYCAYTISTDSWENAVLDNYVDYTTISEEELFQRSTIEEYDELKEIQTLMKTYKWKTE